MGNVMDEMTNGVGNKNKKLLSIILMLVLTVSAVVAVIVKFRKPQLVSPIAEDEGGVRVIFVSPEPSVVSVTSPTASASASPKATPKSTPKASPEPTPKATVSPTPAASSSPSSSPSET